MRVIDSELDSLVEIVRGITFPSSAKRNAPGAGLIACLRTTNVQSKVDWDDLIYVSERYVRTVEQRVRAGDILVSMSNSLDLVGKCALVTDIPVHATFGAFIAVVRARDGIDPRYIHHAMRSPAFKAYLRSVASTTTNISNINSSKLLAARVPLFGEKTCKTIVSKIDELFSEIDEGERALDRVQKLVQRYRQSVLKAAVTGELTREWREKQKGKIESGEALLQRILKARREAWERAKLAERKAKGVRLADDKWKKSYQEPTKPKIALSVELPASWAQLSVEGATCGERPVAYGVLQPGEDLPSGVPLVRVCDIADGAVDTQNLKRILPQVADQFPRTKLRGREVLLTIVGTIGRTAIAPKALAGANVARAVAVMSPTENVTSEWLEICLRHEKARQVLTGAAREVARKTLNLEQLREYAIPVPCLAEQNEVVSRVSALLSRVRAVEEDIESQLLTARALRQAVLKAAFCGALVPQDPNDEPASRILARIVGEHSSARGIARGSRSRKAEHAK